jgi:hypothetical protein
MGRYRRPSTGVERLKRTGKPKAAGAASVKAMYESGRAILV